MHASSSGDWERIEGYIAVSAMVGGGQHRQPERMLTREMDLLGDFLQQPLCLEDRRFLARAGHLTFRKAAIGEAVQNMTGTNL